jgi:hypothetical protein
MKLQLHIRHVICVYEWYAYQNEWNKKYMEFFQAKNIWGYDEISSKPYLCYNVFSNFRFSPEIDCRMWRSSNGTEMML